ncbi:MAG: VCBS repeat-containing protein [Polyangiales bacterium]
MVPDGGASGERLTVDVTAVGPDGDLFTRRATPSYAEGQTKLLDVFLAARCRNVDARRCSVGTACGATGCEPEARPSLADYRPLPVEAPSAPRLLSPRSAGVLTSSLATLRWSAPSNAGAARVELCVDRACATPLRSPIVTAGRCARITRADLVGGAAFWRVTSIATGRASATWELFLGARDAITASASSTRLDLDGDGRAELAYAPSAGGALRVYGGGPRETLASRVTSIEASEASGYGRVASIGDLDGDGFADLVTVSPPGDGLSEARVEVRFGGATSRRITLGSPVDGGFFELPSQRLDARGAGDVDGDGYADVIVGAPHAQRVFVFHGAPSAPLRTTTFEAPAGLPAFGAVVGGAGDVDGDGYDDALVGALGPDLRGRRLFVVPGGVGGLALARRVELLAGSGGATFSVRAEVSAAGDVNGDGNGDLVARDGNAAVYLGPSFLGGSLTPQHVAFGVLSAGASVVSASAGGDLDGDGFGEVLFTLRDSSGRSRVFVEYGRAAPSAVSPAETRPYAVDLGGAGAWSALGVGDLDGDRRDDFVAFDAEANGNDLRVFFGDATGFLEGLSIAVDGGVRVAR